MSGCALKEPHDCATVRQANDALRRHLNRAADERDTLRVKVADYQGSAVVLARRLEKAERALAAFTDCESGILAAVRAVLDWAEPHCKGGCGEYRVLDKYVDDGAGAARGTGRAPRVLHREVRRGHAADGRRVRRTPRVREPAPVLRGRLPHGDHLL
jgi:hypothetical protein